MQRRLALLLLPLVYAFATDLSPKTLIAAPNGGMAPYGSAMLSASSAAATLTAVTNFNTYVTARCGWSLSSANINRLASADWNARVSGGPSITAQQLATAATNLINSKLATMDAPTQRALAQSNFSVRTPKGTLGLNPGNPYVTATRNANGTYSVTVSAQAFSTRKADFQTLAPAMVTSNSNFYPAEAIMVAYSVASGDLGFGSDYVNAMRARLGALTGLNLTNQPLYGDGGFMIRRPLSTFLTDAALSQFFSSVGF
jgi:hypothetical protein